jgi:vacuolar-type H+-ATPase subunit E/Vma4
MAQSSANAFDRFNDALRGLDDQLQELRERFDERRDTLRTSIRKQAQRIETQLRKSALYRRAEEVGKDLQEQVEQARSQLYDVVGIASKAEVDKINRKLSAISKKLNDLAKDQAVDL